MRDNRYQLPVDVYIRRNVSPSPINEYPGKSSRLKTMDWDDFDLYYGFESGDMQDIKDMIPRELAYRLNHEHPEKIIILKDCGHAGKKEKHHPDYDKPFEVEILCEICHDERHYVQRHEVLACCLGNLHEYELC